MNPSRIALPAVTLALAFALSACGGGGGSSGTTAGTPTGGSTPPPAPPPPTAPSPGGLWIGTDPATGLELVGLVTESGEFHFLQEDGVQYFGTVDVASNGTASGTFTGVTPVGDTFADGSTTGSGTITGGSVTERNRLQVSTSFRTARGATTTTTFQLQYEPLYGRASSLATIAGNYRDLDTGATINVNSNGVVFSQDPVTGCVINGNVSIIDARYNAYRVEYSFTGCRGLEAVLNGTTARGLGTLDNTAVPETAVIAVVNAAAGYSLIGVYPRA